MVTYRDSCLVDDQRDRVSKGEDEGGDDDEFDFSANVVNDGPMFLLLPDAVWMEIGSFACIDDIRNLRCITNCRINRIFTSCSFYATRRRHFIEQQRRRRRTIQRHQQELQLTTNSSTDSKITAVHTSLSSRTTTTGEVKNCTAATNHYYQPSNPDVLCFVGGHYSIVMTKKKRSSKEGRNPYSVSGRLGGRSICYESNGHGKIHGLMPTYLLGSLGTQLQSTKAAAATSPFSTTATIQSKNGQNSFTSTQSDTPSSKWRIFGARKGIIPPSSSSTDLSSPSDIKHYNNPICEGTLTESCTVFVPPLGELVYLGGILHDDDNSNIYHDSSSNDEGCTNQVWGYSFYTNQWRQWPSMLEGRTKAMCRAVYVPSYKGNDDRGDNIGRIIVVGSDPEPKIGSRYDLCMKQHQRRHKAASASTKKARKNDFQPPATRPKGCCCEMFDLKKQSWTLFPDIPYHPGDLSNAVVACNRFVVMCQNSSNRDEYDDIGDDDDASLDDNDDTSGLMYDVEAHHWTILPPFPDVNYDEHSQESQNDPNLTASRRQRIRKSHIFKDIVSLNISSISNACPSPETNTSYSDVQRQTTISHNDENSEHEKVIVLHKNISQMFVFDPFTLQWSVMNLLLHPSSLCLSTNKRQEENFLFIYNEKITLCISSVSVEQQRPRPFVVEYNNCNSPYPSRSHIFYQLCATTTEGELLFGDIHEGQIGFQSMEHRNSSTKGEKSTCGSFWTWKRILNDIDIPLSQLKGAHFFSLTL